MRVASKRKRIQRTSLFDIPGPRPRSIPDTVTLWLTPAPSLPIHSDPTGALRASFALSESRRLPGCLAQVMMVLG